MLTENVERTLAMSTTLKNLVRPLTGYSRMQKFALFLIADLAGPDSIAKFYTETLAEWMCCSARSTQYALRALEKKGNLISLQEKTGRGHHHVYRVEVVNVTVPVVTEPLPAAIPPTNSTKPLTVYDPLPEETPEQRERVKAMLAAKKAELLAKKREDKRERPGRTARNHTKLV